MLTFGQAGNRADDLAGTSHSLRSSCPAPNWLCVAARPVLRTLYNHTQVPARPLSLSLSLSLLLTGMCCCLQPVNDLDWHPYKSILLSCGKDSTIKYAPSLSRSDPAI